ncbi:MAG TPA: acyltransferase [Candidatus Eremiobacteraceae bacterium]|nr:acyltransferase [Candidatus Eremiobacteraceae bacterium]
MDGLRAVAVLGVVLCHAAKYTMDFHQGWTYHALAEGAHGVDLFFVISGFCLAYPVLRRVADARATSFDVVQFFSRRIVRIVPTYWIAFGVVLAAALLVRRLGGDVPWPTIRIPSAAAGVGQLFFVHGGFDLVGSFWTLAVEVRWYLAFPLLLWLYIRSPLGVYAAGFASLAVYWLAGVHVWDFATLPGFLLGIVAADLTIREHAVRRYALPLFALSVPVSLWLEPHGHLDYALQNQLWWQVSAFLLVLGATVAGPVRALVSNAAVAFIGTAAYSIYLFSDPIEAWYGHYGGASTIACAAAGVLIGVLAWLLVERYFTAPANRDRLVAPLRRAGEAVARWLRLPAALRMRRPLPASVT